MGHGTCSGLVALYAKHERLIRPHSILVLVKSQAWNAWLGYDPFGPRLL
jgi:hypothetical protein